MKRFLFLAWWLIATILGLIGVITIMALMLGTNEIINLLYQLALRFPQVEFIILDLQSIQLMMFAMMALTFGWIINLAINYLGGEKAWDRIALSGVITFNTIFCLLSIFTIDLDLLIFWMTATLGALSFCWYKFTLST